VLDPRGGGKGARLSGAAASQEMRGRSGAHSRSHCRTCIPRTSIAKLTLDAMLRARRFAAAVEGRRRVQEQLAQGERIVAELAREDDVLGGTSYAPAQLARRGADEPADLVVPQCRRKEKRSLSRSAEAKQRDAEMFKISSVRADANSEAGLSMREQSKDRLQSIEDMVMEMDPDDAQAMIKKRAQMRWDPRSKKFVKDFDGVPSTKGKNEGKERVNEAGRKIKKGYKVGLYDKWKERHKARIQTEGEEEDRDAASAMQRPGGRRYRHMAGTPGHGGKMPRDELKNKDQIRKERAKKANLKELQLPKAVRKLKEQKQKQEAAAQRRKAHMKPHMSKGMIRKSKR
jgi:hypothetical protein